VIGVACSLFSYSSRTGILQTLRRTLAQRNYVTFFADTGIGAADVSETIEEIARLNAEGVILLADTPCPDSVRQLSASIPLILVSPFRLEGVPTLLLDHRSAVERLTLDLAAKEHSRMMFCTWDPVADGAKIAGFNAVVERDGLSGEVVNLPRARNAVAGFVQEHIEMFDRSSAFLAGHDRLAAALIHALREAGRSVPEDGSVAGFGDTEIARLITPQLTTLRPPREEVGAHAVEMLVERVAGRSVEGRVLVPELVERGSTGVCLEVSESSV
jgi:LacI family transcriptional regulator